MKKNSFLMLASASLLLMMAACNETSKKEKTDKPLAVEIKEDTSVYNLDSVTMIGYVAWDASSSVKRPVVLVIPEWWGLNEYTQSRVKQLAQLGYLAFGVDMYGNALKADNPKMAGELATPFYKDPALAKARFDAAVAKALSYPVADADKVAVIGYCFGGTQALNVALLGDKLKAAVSFHGGLETAPVDKNLLKADILICHGEADNFVPAEQVAAFRKKLDSISATYTFKSYPNATHAFTNPQATETGKKFNMPIAYNAAADTASWNDMKLFLDKVFK